MKIHVVQKGDTLWEISRQYDADFEEIKQLNSQLSSPDMIMPGMKIKIPSSAKSVQKEETKEMQQPETEPPYKEMQQPKPVPVMEDEKENQVEPQKPKEQQMPDKEQQKKPSVPESPEQPEVKQPAQAPQQPMQPTIQMPIMEQELKNYTSVHIPEMPQYEKPKEQPVEQEHPLPQQPMHHPMPHPVAMVPVCCQMLPPGAMPMPHHPHFPATGPDGSGCGPWAQPNKQQGSPFPMYPHPHSHYEHGMMESPSIEMPVKPSLMGNVKGCGCEDKQTMLDHHQGHNMAQQPPYYHASSHPFHAHHPSHGHSDKLQAYPPSYGAMSNDPSFPAPPGYPDFSGAGNRAEEDES